MSAEPPEYYRARAAQERDAAARAPNRGIFRFHDELATMYDRMAQQATGPGRDRELAD